MTTTYQIEALEYVIAPGKSTAYKIGYGIGRAASIALDFVTFWD